MNALTQLLGGMTQLWPNVTFIVCVFAILIFKPERIAKSSLFWFGCLLFALSLVAPTINMFLPMAKVNPMQPRLDISIPLGLKLANLASALLFAGAFLATVSAIMPTPSPKTPATTDVFPQ